MVCCGTSGLLFLAEFRDKSSGKKLAPGPTGEAGRGGIANLCRHHQYDSAMSVHPFSSSGRFTFTAEEQASISSGHQRIIPLIIIHHTLSKTNSLPLKMNGWKMTFPLGKAFFVRGILLTFREGKSQQIRKFRPTNLDHVPTN